MTKSSFVYEEGTAVDVGSDGQHAFEFVGGAGLLDNNKSNFVFVHGTGIGGGISVIIEGVSVGFYESSDRTLREIQNSDNLYYDDPAGDSDSPGYEAVGFTSSGTSHRIWVGVFHSTKNGADDWGIGYYGWGNDENTQAEYAMIFENSDPIVAGNPTDPPGQDDRLSEGASGGFQDDQYGTESDGDLRSDHVYGLSSGDGGLYKIDPTATSLPITIEATVTGATEHPNGGSGTIPDYWRGNGPDDTFTGTVSGSDDSITVELR